MSIQFSKLRFLSRIITKPAEIKNRQSFIVNNTSSCRLISTNSTPKKSKQFFYVTWKSFGISATIGAGLLYYLHILKEAKDRKMAIERKRQLGKAAIGGKFELMDCNSKPVKSDDFLGKWVLIYFGFTHCPDVCPEELEKMVKTVEYINKNNVTPNVTPIFITVDPDRDTPEIVGKYLKEFSEDIIGLTGTKEQIDKCCKTYRVYYSMGPPDPDNDYIVDHTIIIYLINPDGEFVDYYGQTRNYKEVADGIVFQMMKYNKLKKRSLLDNFFPESNQNVQ